MKITTRRRQGISLIVLVITIIIMIILATAVILSLSSSDITDKANKAVADTKLSQANERATMCIAEWELMTEEQRRTAMSEFPEVGDDITLKRYVEEKLKESGILTSTELANEYKVAGNGRVTIRTTYTMVASADEESINVPVPEGFTASTYEGENTVAGGFVIYETNSLIGVTKETAQTTYNQFVWVPVEKTFERIAWKDENLITTYTEPFSQKYNEVTLSLENDLTREYAEHNAMVYSVERYGGFYIGRYEAGTNSVRTNDTTETTSVLVQKGKPVYNYVGWGQSMISATRNVTWDGKLRGKGAVELSRSICPNNSTNTKGVVSTLCYGVQWDAVMEWLEDIPNISDYTKKYIRNSTGMGWFYQDEPTTTGYYEVKNIYDMGGNVWEWTMESYNTLFRILRGGCYENDGTSAPASIRINYNPSGVGSYYGFRPSLYIK